MNPGSQLMGLDVLMPIFGSSRSRDSPPSSPSASAASRSRARVLKGVGESRGRDLELRIRDLTDQVEALTAEVRDLRSARSFDQKLLESKEHVTSAL